ncbi:vasculin-like protein 1 isoform X1 [Elephas maximus indicus]|uniref:vasculin-like protein 1 isoform X1 n=1 Tax=Elephas maximus indicus TaxID=99487 RepID=UPI002116B23D|nr:vasculin-like protein 1 isoform X1 [Elephas maximus indicus]
MAQCGFVPRWLNISTPLSAKSPTTAFEKHGQHLPGGEGRSGAGSPQHNCSDSGSSSNQPTHLYCSVGSGLAMGGPDAEITESPSAWHGSSWGHDGTSQHSGGAAGNHSHWDSSLHTWKASAAQEKPPTVMRKEKEDKVEKLQLGQKDFPPLNPQAGQQHQPCRPTGTPSGVWKNPPSIKQPSKMLVIKKVSGDDPAAAFSAAFTSPGSHLVNRNKSSTALPRVCRSQVLKLVPSPSKPSALRLTKVTRRSTDRRSVSLRILKYNQNVDPGPKSAVTSPISVSKAVALAGGTVPSSPKGTTPPAGTSASRLTKVTRRKTDMRSASLRIRKYNQNRDFSRNRGRDKLQDLENNYTPEPREKAEDSCLQKGLALPMVQEGKVPLHSLEAELRLLKEMGWQECPKSEEDCLPLTEDELQEFHRKTEQLRRNGFGKKGFSQGRSSSPFSPWRSVGAAELEDTEADASGSDTSDDEAWD